MCRVSACVRACVRAHVCICEVCGGGGGGRGGGRHCDSGLAWRVKESANINNNNDNLERLTSSKIPFRFASIQFTHNKLTKHIALL